jgi:hypothetical protein
MQYRWGWVRVQISAAKSTLLSKINEPLLYGRWAAIGVTMTEQTLKGHCHCGAIVYEIDGKPISTALCHCRDCTRHAGAPAVAWVMLPDTAVKVTRGTPKIYASSVHGRRHFCADCGTGLFYTNEEILPGIIDAQTATLDNPEAFPPEARVQIAERAAWMEQAHALPAFDRYRMSGEG